VRIRVKIKQAPQAKDLPLPSYATTGSSGVDLYAACEDKVLVEPRSIHLVPTGIYISLPLGYEAEIRPRSGLALRHGITLVNTPGTIDSDYRGMIKLILTNLGPVAFEIKRGDRIAQMVFKETVRADFEVSDELDETVRSDGGFGHTGV